MSPIDETRQVVVLQSVQPIGSDLSAAFPAELFAVRILTSGRIDGAVRPGVSTTVPVEAIPLEQWAQRLREIAAGGPVELVTNDEYCLEVCATLRRELGLPPRLEMPLAPYRDKVLMKEVLTAAGVAVPAFLPLEPVPPPSESAAKEILGALGPRLVVKPRREANNRGVAAIDSRAELERWLGAHAGEGGWEAESFLEGTIFHANALVQDGQVRPLLVGEYVGSPLALEGGGAIGSLTIPWEARAAQQGRRLNRQVVEALGGCGQFVIHTEFVREPSGRVVFLETAARAPGALVSEMSAIHVGVHLEQLNLRVQIGEAAEAPTPTGKFGAWVWFPRSEEVGGRPRAPRCGHRLEVLPAASSIAYSLLVWDPDPERLRGELWTVLRSG
jgi:biotin carboxylase